MNKDEVLQLAADSGARMVSHGLSTNRTMAAFVTTETLLIFANACEKIGMEKAAKICDEASSQCECVLAGLTVVGEQLVAAGAKKQAEKLSSAIRAHKD